MKKPLLTLLLSFCYIMLFAQVGITVGGNMAKYKYNTGADRKFILGFNAGLFYNYDINEKIAVQPELAYTIKGATLYTEIFIGSNNPVMKYQNRLNYLQLSLPFSTHFEISEGLDFDLGAGLFISYLTGATYTAKNFDGTSSKNNYNIGNTTTDDFKALDYGINAKIGFTLSKTIGFHFKYEAGLADLSPIANDPKLSTGNTTFNISYTFGSKE